MTEEIEAILKAYHYNTLQDMAEEAGINTDDLLKAELIAQMKSRYFTEERVRASLEKLNERERTVLNRLLLHEGKVTTHRFQRELRRANLVTKTPELDLSSRSYSYRRSGVPYDRGVYVGEPHREDSQVFEDIIARLTFYGLVFSRGTSTNSAGASYKIQFHPADVIYIPQAIRPYFPEPEPVPPPLADWEPDRVESGTPAVLLRDLYLYWDYARRHDVKLLQSGFVGKRPLKAINDVLLVPDPRLSRVQREDSAPRLYLLRRMLEILGLVRKEDGYLRSTGGDNQDIPPFWGWDQAKQLRTCLDAWTKIEGLRELGDEAEDYAPRYTHARQMILKVIQVLPPDEWTEPAEILDKIQVHDRNFLFPGRQDIGDGKRYYSYYGGRYYRSSKKLLQLLEGLEIAFVNNCLTGFLSQAGIVDLGYENDTLRAFRLRSALDAEQTEEKSSLQAQRVGGRLIIQPTFELMAMGPVGLDVFAQLDLFAERQRAGQAVFEYRLSRDSIYQAQQRGLDVDEIIHFLERTSDTDLPQNVRRSLEEWSAHYERFTFRSGVDLVQTADAALMETLLDDPQIGSHIARSVAPDIALLKNNQQTEVVTALVEQGHLPTISEARPESADDSVIIQEDGSIRPVHAVPMLHLRGRLSRLAEETDDHIWHLTPTSIRQAGGDKKKVVSMLRELRKLNRGPLPDELIERIKSDGGYYGAAAIETLTLVEFRDRAALDELREHPRLREVLTPFSAGHRALATLPTDELSRVKDILADFGVHVEDGLQKA
jgi:hypothetical protein